MKPSVGWFFAAFCIRAECLWLPLVLRNFEASSRGIASNRWRTKARLSKQSRGQPLVHFVLVTLVILSQLGSFTKPHPLKLT